MVCVMKSKNLVFWSLVFVLTLASLGYGMYVNYTIIDDTNTNVEMEDGENRQLHIDDNSIFNDYFDTNNLTLEELFEMSDLVVVGKVGEKRVNTCTATRSDFLIEETLVGESGEKICVIEPSYFSYQEDYYSIGGYNLMQNGKTYMLFLEELPHDEKITVSKKDVAYKPLSICYSKYCLDSETVVTIEEANEPSTFLEVQDYALITRSQQIVRHYEELKRSILS